MRFVMNWTARTLLRIERRNRVLLAADPAPGSTVAVLDHPAAGGERGVDQQARLGLGVGPS